MKIALISDIHGNLEALKTVLEDVKTRKVDKIHCLGDVVGYGSEPRACLELVRDQCDIKLMGNHEYVALGLQTLDDLNELAQQSIGWTTNQLTDREFSIIADFEMDAVEEDCYFVHSSPHQPDRWNYILTAWEAEQGFTHCKHKIGFLGHTHLPMIFSQGKDGSVRCQTGHDFDPFEDTRYLVNVGSVGQPRDGDPRACYCVYDSAECSVAYHRISYDIKRTQDKMTKAKLPSMLIERLEVGR